MNICKNLKTRVMFYRIKYVYLMIKTKKILKKKLLMLFINEKKAITFLYTDSSYLFLF